MSRISNIIRGLFGRKPVHQQNKSTASQMGRATAPKSEKMIQKMPVKTMRKEESDMETQGHASTGNRSTDNEEWGTYGTFML